MAMVDVGESMMDPGLGGVAHSSAWVGIGSLMCSDSSR